MTDAGTAVDRLRDEIATIEGFAGAPERYQVVLSYRNAKRLDARLTEYEKAKALSGVAALSEETPDAS